MRQLSVIVSDYLHEQIVEKGRRIGVDNMSDAVRILLLSAIENDDLGSNGALEKALHNRATHYSILDHYLFEECLLALVEEGSKMKDQAYEKAEKMISTLSQKTSEFPSE